MSADAARPSRRQKTVAKQRRTAQLGYKVRTARRRMAGRLGALRSGALRAKWEEGPAPNPTQSELRRQLARLLGVIVPWQRPIFANYIGVAPPPPASAGTAEGNSGPHPKGPQPQCNIDRNSARAIVRNSEWRARLRA